MKLIHTVTRALRRASSVRPRRAGGAAQALGGIGLVVVLAAPTLSHAQDTRTVDVLGSITAEVGGEEREWLTISGGVDGMDGASAVWSPYAPPQVPMPSHLNEEQRAVMRERLEAMSGVLGDQAGPMMEALGGGGDSDSVKLRITGFDPEAERMLREGVLSIEVSPFAAGDAQAALAASHDADVSYFRNRGPDTGLYVSAHSVGPNASVDFDRLEIVSDGGRADGRFAATLCPVKALMRNQADPEDCVPVSGTFETALEEETPPDGAP